MDSENQASLHEVHQVTKYLLCTRSLDLKLVTLHVSATMIVLEIQSQEET